MLWRWLTTGAAALLGLAGAALLDCTYPFVGFVDAFDICIEADLVVPGGSVAVGIVLIAGGVALLAYSWAPFLVELYREHEGLEETGKALVENVHRLPHEASGPVEKLLPRDDEADIDEKTADPEKMSVDLRHAPSETEVTPGERSVGPDGARESLLRRVELMETLLREEKVAPEAVAKHWIELLREANGLHSDRTIDEMTFREANTRLLALYVSPDDDTRSARHKVGSDLVTSKRRQGLK